MSKRARIVALILAGFILCGCLFLLFWTSPQKWHSGWAGLFIISVIMLFGLVIMIGFDWAASNLSHSAKISFLLGLTSLVVTFVRRSVQYNRYSWDTVWQFVIWWLIHFFGLVIFIFVAYACILWTEEYFFGYKKDDTNTKDKLIIYILMVVLVAAVAIFGLDLMADMGPINEDFEY